MKKFLNNYKYSLLAIILLYGVAYKFSLKKTIQLNTALQTLLVTENGQKHTPTLLKQLQEKNTYYNEFLKKNNIATSPNNNLLNVLSTLCDRFQLLIAEYKEPHVFEDMQNQYLIITHIFKVEGNYKSIIQLIANLEKNYQFGKISHLNFEKIKNYKNNKEQLFCTVHLERYSEINNNTN